jgi:hypothetical protein
VKLLNEYFYVWVLLFLILYYSSVGIYALGHIDTANAWENNFMTAMLDNQKLVIGALLGLITGKKIAESKEEPPSVVTPQEPPKIG